MTSRRALLIPCFLVLAVAIAFGAIGRVQPVRAGVSFTVNSTLDAVDMNPGDGVCATAAGTCTLRAAVQETEALPGADTIILPPGIYFRTRGNTGLQPLNSEGAFTISDTLTIVGAGPQATVIDTNNEDTTFRVLATGSLTVSGLTITHCFLEAIDNFGIVRLSDAAVTTSFGERVLLSNAGSMSIARATVTGNSRALNRSGIPVVGNGSNGTLTLTDVSIQDNRCIGGIFPAPCGVDNVGVATLTNVTISENRGGNGTGIYANGPTTLTNVTVTGNSVVAAGTAPLPAGSGGIRVGATGVLRAMNVTLSGNSGPNGANLTIDAGGSATFLNTIIANPISSANCAGIALTSLGYNLSSDASCNLTGPGDLQNTNPLLGLLQNNGGFTPTLALLPGSPAIDGGANTGCPATDQRGIPRPQDGNNDGLAVCDIGAYEVQGATPPPPPPSPTPPPLSIPPPQPPLPASISNASKNCQGGPPNGALCLLSFTASGPATAPGGSFTVTLAGPATFAAAPALVSAPGCTTPPAVATIPGSAISFTITNPIAGCPSPTTYSVGEALTLSGAGPVSQTITSSAGVSVTVAATGLPAFQPTTGVNLTLAGCSLGSAFNPASARPAPTFQTTLDAALGAVTCRIALSDTDAVPNAVASGVVVMSGGAFAGGAGVTFSSGGASASVAGLPAGDATAAAPGALNSPANLPLGGPQISVPCGRTAAGLPSAEGCQSVDVTFSIPAGALVGSPLAQFIATLAARYTSDLPGVNGDGQLPRQTAFAVVAGAPLPLVLGTLPTPTPIPSTAPAAAPSVAPTTTTTPVNQTLALGAGCTNLTPAVSEPVVAYLARVSPPGVVLGLFQFDAAGGRFLAVPGPNAPAGAAAVADLSSVSRLTPVFLCLAAPATLTQPAL